MSALQKASAMFNSKRRHPGVKKHITSDVVTRVVEGIFDSENKLQNEVIKRLMPLEEALGFRVIAIPNGGKRRPREAQQFKNRGLRAGVPDLLVLRKNSLSPVVFIELKTETGSTSEEQIEWHAWLGNHLFPVHVCTSVQSVLTVLRSHGIRI